MRSYELIIIGAGAAGMMAAVSAAENGIPGEKILVLERNEKPGKKIYITGKGRCNLTNACGAEELFSNIPRQAKFLYPAFYAFSNQNAIEFFEHAGMKTKTERGNRVFPASGHASDVIRVLADEMKRNGIRVEYHARVKRLLEREGEIRGTVLCDGKCFDAERVLIATGGMSYPSTGSSGDGYVLARQMGHEITGLHPSLVPFAAGDEDLVPALQGLAPKNVRVKIFDPRKPKKILFEDFGEMLFTHFGVSGPLMLTASSLVGAHLDAGGPDRRPDRRSDGEDACQAGYGGESPVGNHSDGSLTLLIDWKPALSEEELDRRILRDFEENKNRQFKNALGGLIPAKLIPVLIARSGIPGEKKVNGITRQERKNLTLCLKQFSVTLTGLRDFNEAIITRGGIALNGVNPSTMESKRIRGLLFAGEVLDLDALTGGFNLQIAWSTGYLAGFHAAEEYRLSK